MNSNIPSLLNASDISLRSGGLPFVRVGSPQRIALLSRMGCSPNGAYQRFHTRRMPRKSILILLLDAFPIHQPYAPTVLL